MTWNQKRLKTLILVFFITAVWDIVLRFMAEGKIKFFGVEDMKWVVVLKEYFQEYSVLAAALLAGFVGAFTYYNLVYILEYLKPASLIQVGIITFLVSGLVGIPMRTSGSFPVLKEYYYDRLGFNYSFITDAMSGVVVAITLITLQKINIAPN
jgi:hypothetical protein